MMTFSEGERVSCNFGSITREVLILSIAESITRGTRYEVAWHGMGGKLLVTKVDARTLKKI